MDCWVKGGGMSKRLVVITLNIIVSSILEFVYEIIYYYFAPFAIIFLTFS